MADGKVQRITERECADVVTARDREFRATHDPPNAMIEFKLEQLGAGSGADGANPVAVIGIGGAGAAVVDQLAVDGIKGAELASMNSDVRALESGLAPRKVQLGRMLTQGLGCGGDPELGEEAAAATMEEIAGVVAGRKIVFLCVGLGGGVGGGGGGRWWRVRRGRLVRRWWCLRRCRLDLRGGGGGSRQGRRWRRCVGMRMR